MCVGLGLALIYAIIVGTTFNVYSPLEPSHPKPHSSYSSSPLSFNELKAWRSRYDDWTALHPSIKLAIESIVRLADDGIRAIPLTVSDWMAVCLPCLLFDVIALIWIFRAILRLTRSFWHLVRRILGLVESNWEREQTESSGTKGPEPNTLYAQLEMALNRSWLPIDATSEQVDETPVMVIVVSNEDAVRVHRADGLVIVVVTSHTHSCPQIIRLSRLERLNCRQIPPQDGGPPIIKLRVRDDLQPP